MVRLEAVGREANYFDITPLEIGSTARDFGEFGRADRSEVIGMRKKNGLLSLTNAGQGQREIEANPGVTNPFVEIDATFRCLSLKIGGSTS